MTRNVMASHAFVHLTPCQTLYKVCMSILSLQMWKLRFRGIHKLADLLGLSDPGVPV